MVIDGLIGGEFEVTLPDKRGEDIGLFSEGTLYSSGRSAIYHIIKSIQQEKPNINKVFVPDYICDSVLEALNLAHICWEVYYLNDELTIDRNRICSINLHNSAIIIVNYFGLSDTVSEIAYIKSLSSEICVIEDDVQSFYSMLGESEADYRVTSFRKTFPLPDGGWVKSKHYLQPAQEENKFVQYKVAGSILKGLLSRGYFSDEIFLHLLDKGEKMINENIEKGISRFTLDSLCNIDYRRFGLIRRQNADYLVNGLKMLGVSPIMDFSETSYPLFIPICLKNRDKVRQEMFSHNIFCPVHWPLRKVHQDRFIMGIHMAKEELSLIVDQRYSFGDMERILHVIKENI